jgi:hypothetical protein
VTQLEPDELSRLLHAAVEPVRPSPDAYQRIRAGVAWRRRWRVPGLAVAGLAMAAIVGLAVFAIRPQSSDQVVEPVPPAIVTTVSQGSVLSNGAATEPRRTGGTAPGGGGASARNQPPSAGPTSPGATTQPGAASSGPSTAPPDEGSPTLPPAAFRPAHADDIDGDGEADQVRLTGTTTLEVTFSRGRTVSVPLPVVAISPLRKAIVDIDGDGYGEVILQVVGTGTADTYEVLRYGAGDTLQPLTAPAPGLTSGVDGTSASGFKCTGRALQVSNGVSRDGGSTFQVTTTTWNLTMAGFSQQGGPVTTTVSDTALFVAACGNLS